MNDAQISNSTPSEVTEFSLESYVLLEPVLTSINKKGRINTCHKGPFLIKGISGNTYTLENQRNKKSVWVHINRLVPFIFGPERVNPQSVAAPDVDEFHIESILSHRDYKRSLEFKLATTK